MKTKKEKKEINRLFDLEVDEVSLVDKPAIGESFIVTKSLKNKGVDVMSKIEKTVKWKEKKLKNEDGGDACGFCHIKDEDASMGLLCSVCFDCALKREEKGVFDACVEGTFSMEEYKKENPEDEAFKTTEVESDEKGNTGKPKAEEKTTEVPNGSSEDSDIYLKRITKLEEGLTDVSSMLSQSLELHGVAADALNQVMSLTFGALDLLIAGMDKEEDEKSVVNTLKNDLKLAHEDISKAGAKISSGRLAVLRDIAEKLTSLIESVAAQKESELESEKGSKEETSKSIEDLKLEISDLKKSVLNSVESVEGKLSERFKSVDERIEGLENSGVGSSSIEDEDDSLAETQKSNSVFGNILGLDEIQKSARARIGR